MQVLGGEKGIGLNPESEQEKRCCLLLCKTVQKVSGFTWSDVTITQYLFFGLLYPSTSSVCPFWRRESIWRQSWWEQYSPFMALHVEEVSLVFKVSFTGWHLLLSFYIRTGGSRKEITEHWEWLEQNLLQTLSIFENENDITTFVRGKIQVVAY